MSEAEQATSSVLIVGGGVAALEAVLALHELAPELVEVTLMSDQGAFEYKALSVAKPFGGETPPPVDLADFSREFDATFLRERFTALDPDANLVHCESGAEVGYDYLLLAIGARPVDALPNAMTFTGSRDTARFEDLLSQLKQGLVGSVVFAVPDIVHWALPLYELAILTADELAAAEVDAELTVVTHESRPLSTFGRRASGDVAALLERSGIKVITGALPDEVSDDGLSLLGGGFVPAERVVAQPALEVPSFERLPQGPRGFIGTDTEMRVEGTLNIWAAGDATWFPIKQGGLAAQQADVAATVIAARAGADVQRAPFRPVIRAALLTADGPHYLRTGIGDREQLSAAGTEVLWWPPSKVAGRFLAPYLSAKGRETPPGPPLEDLEPLLDADSTTAQADHRDAVDLALSAADAGARWGDFKGALRWLDLAEQLDIVLPSEYARKRRDWQAELQQGHS
ncbi:MAG: NAD(P)/FAD-dependent oxidoreductase [Solirubrobacterales bacterium]